MSAAKQIVKHLSDLLDVRNDEIRRLEDEVEKLKERLDDAPDEETEPEARENRRCIQTCTIGDQKKSWDGKRWRHYSPIQSFPIVEAQYQLKNALAWFRLVGRSGPINQTMILV